MQNKFLEVFSINPLSQFRRNKESTIYHQEACYMASRVGARLDNNNDDTTINFFLTGITIFVFLCNDSRGCMVCPMCSAVLYYDDSVLIVSVYGRDIFGRVRNIF